MLIENMKSSYEGTKGNISIILKDLTNDRWIFNIDENRTVPSASTIKVLIMIEALNQVLEGKYELRQKIKIKDDDIVNYSIIKDLTTDTYNYVDLITLMIIVSDNTATNVLIDLLGFDKINKMADILELKSTVLKRKMMDFEAIKEGRQNNTSAMDMAIIMEKIYRNEILSTKMCDLMIDILKRQNHRDMLGRYIPEDVIMANKTGGLERLGHDIGIIYLSNITYLIGVFVTYADSNSEAKKITGRISKEVYDYYNLKFK